VDEERHEKAIKCSYAQHVLPIAVVYDQQYWEYFLKIQLYSAVQSTLCYVSVQWFRHSQHEFILCSKKNNFPLFVHCNIGIHKHQFLWLILLDPLAMYHSIFFNNAEMLFVIIILVCYPHCCCCCCWWYCLQFYYWINFQDVCMYMKKCIKWTLMRGFNHIYFIFRAYVI
jgi:hypothetical protein